MAFFDGLGKKITNVSQSAVQKTKGMTDISKLNNQIAEEERKLSNTIFQLGKSYVSKHFHDADCEFFEFIEEIRRSEDIISGYKQQILEIKGISKCERCGAEVPLGTAFCSGCGMQMPVRKAVVNVNTVVCSNCGATMDSAQKFCCECGAPMGGQAVVNPAQNPTQAPYTPAYETEQTVYMPETEPVMPQVTSAPEAMPQQEVPDAQNFDFMRPTIKCPMCGSEHDEGLYFCTQCGTKLQ